MRTTLKSVVMKGIMTLNVTIAGKSFLRIDVQDESQHGGRVDICPPLAYAFSYAEEEEVEKKKEKE